MRKGGRAIDLPFCILLSMSTNFTAYNPLQTPIHRIDARVKIVLVIAYSVALFFVGSWTGMALCAALLGGAVAVSRIRVLKCARQLLPLGIVLCFTVIANSFSFDISSEASLHGIGAVSAGLLQDAKPIAIAGSFGFVPAGFARGCFYVLRIVLLVYASLVLVTTTASSQISHALNRFLSPLGKLGVPVHDVSTSVSIALRFIPVVIDEFDSVRIAQVSRGANFDSGSLIARLKMWASVLIPMFVGLFRRADRLATAMDARCYGMGRATCLNDSRMSASSLAVLLAGLLICILIGAML